MGFRVATWNVNYRGTSAAPALGTLVRRYELDLLLLQEANANAVDLLCHVGGLDWAVTAYDAGAVRPTGRSGRGRVAALVGRGDPPTEIGILPDVALPERAVFGSMMTATGPITVMSYHAPPGVSWGITKVNHAHALLRWINATPGQVIVGADANTPEIDHPNPAMTQTHWHTGRAKLGGDRGDDVVFGGALHHRLRDAHRLWLQQHPDVLSSIIRERPKGPLAVSHRTGKTRRSPGVPRRFDTLWVGPELEVLLSVYDYANAVTAGSDHALVVADLITAIYPQQ